MLISQFEEYAENKGILHNIKANIILSASLRKCAEADRERIIDHLNRCIHYCERATVDGRVTIVQATLRMALAKKNICLQIVFMLTPGGTFMRRMPWAESSHGIYVYCKLRRLLHE